MEWSWFEHFFMPGYKKSIMDARSKLIDIAAFMERVQRSGETDDYRD
jgi:hypothetical protein